MKNEQKFLFLVIAIGIYTATVGSAVAAEPTLGQVTLNPEQPTKFSKITFTVNVIGEDIKTVKIVVLECNASTGVCQNTRDNQTMQNIGGSQYRADVTLDYPSASYITYWVFVETNAGATATLPDKQGVKLNLSAGSSNGNNGGDDTPGFEGALFIAAICGALILLARKRFR